MTLVQSEPKAIKIGIPKSDYSAMQGPCDAGYHIPQASEYETLLGMMTTLGVSTVDYFKSYLKMPLAGYYYAATGDAYSANSYGYYWCCTAYNDYARAFLIRTGYDPSLSSTFRGQGVSIRPFKNTPVVPDSNWTTIYQGTGDAGIYHNSTEGLISISSDGSTWLTIADKNLGATTVYVNGATLTSQNCGNRYQRGNNYGFLWSEYSVSPQSSTKVDASNYGPGNYYSSSTFIKSSTPYDWSKVKNDNLRGGVTGATIYPDTDIKAVYLGTTKVRPPYKPRTFTITRTEQSDMSSGWTYSDDAAGLTAGSTDFDEFFGYYGCRLNTSGVETAKVTQEESGGAGKLDITQLGTLTSGDNVMIAFPIRGIKMSKSGSVVTLSITEELEKDGYQYYAFQQGQINNITATKDKFYMGTYMGTTDNNKLKSWSGQQPIRSYTQANYITYAGNNGTGYTIEGFYQRMYIAALYMMKYGNPNYRTTVGYGYAYNSSYAQTVTTGGTDSQTNATYGNTSQTNVQAKLFGLEDRWGSRGEFIGGAYLGTSKVLYTQLSGYSGAISGGVTTGATVDGTNSFISAIAGTNKAMFAPTSTVSSRSYYICETVTNVANRILCGGDYSRGLIGLYVWQTTDTNNNAGARLMYL